MRASFFPALFLAGTPLLAQDVQLESKRTRWRVGFETVDVPGTEDLGLIGVHHDVLGPLREFPPLYLGIGGYAAVTGELGGFLLGGVTVGTLFRLLPHWYLDAGVFLGGGGGGGSPPADGWAVRPFVALERALGLVALRGEVALLDMDALDSDVHLAIGLSLPSELLLARRGRIAREIPDQARIERPLRVTPRALWLHPGGDSHRRNGSELDEDLSLLGLGVDYFVGDLVFLPLEVYGAVGNDAADLVLALAGLGLSVPLSELLSLEAKVEVGAGGGSDVDTGGGFLWQALAGLRAHVSRRVSLEAFGGFIEAPDSEFEATAVSLGLSWSANPIELRLDFPRGNLAREGLSAEDTRIGQTRFSVLGKLYDPPSSAHKKNGEPHEDGLGLIGVGAEQPLGRGLALTARAFTGIEGDIGGYSEALLGGKFEFRTHWLEGHAFFVAGELGAAGGARVDVESGLIYHASGGWRYEFGERTFATLEFGRVEADRGSFEAGSLIAGLGWTLARAYAR